METNCTPSVIAKLMGFDELTRQQPNHKQHRVLSEDYLRKTAAIGFQVKRSFYEDRSSKKKVQKQQEVKYVQGLQPQCDMGNPTALKSTNASNSRDNGKCKKSENILRSRQKLDGGSITDIDYFHNLLKSPLELKDDKRHSPTPIVVLKPNLGKAKIAARSPFLPSSHPCSQSGYRNQGFCRRMNGELYNEVRNKERDKEIYRQIKHIINSRFTEVPTPEVTVENTAVNGPEAMMDSCVNFIDQKNQDDSSFSSLDGSSFASEAKKKLSEQWKTTKISQVVEVDSRGFTLGEMLDIPCDEESRPGNLNYTVDKHQQCSRFSLNKTTGTSKSRSRKEAFYNGKFLMREKAVNEEVYTSRNQNVMNKERSKLRDSRFSWEKSPPSSYAHLVNNNHTIEEAPVNLDELENKLEDLSEENYVVSKCKDLDCNYPSQGIQGEQEKSAAEVIIDAEIEDVCYSYSQVWEASNGQQSSIGAFEDGLNFSSCTKIDSEFSMSSGEAYQPSPNSVLETPFTEEILSGSKCFESVNADLYGVWMQLHLLKSEAEDTHEEEPCMLVSSDEDTFKGSVDYSEENCKLTRLFKPEESRDFSYLVDVLDEANFFEGNLETSFEIWYSPEIPLDPSVFDALEKKYGEQTWWKKSERRLLFDRINLGLTEILWPYTDSNTQSKPLRTQVCATSRRNVIEEDLWVLLISQENEVYKDLSEKAIGREIRWLDLGDDIDIIAREIEIFLFDELVTELS
ncbi:hypothetical protein LguiB_029570 [Lonicera macranthoides]